MADDFSTCDALRDLNRSKLLDGNLPIPWSEGKKNLEGRKVNPSYLEGLYCLWSKAETRDIHIREGSEGVVCTDSLRDLKRSKTVRKDLDVTWDDCKKHLESKNTDVHYVEGLRLIWQNVEEKNTRRRETKKEDDPDGDDSDEDDTDGDDIDPQYEFFLANLKEHGRSYALEVDKNGETSLLPYELEGGEGKRKRKMRDVEPVDVLSSEMIGVLNNTETVDRHRNICVRCSRSIMDPLVRENEVLNRKSVTGLVIENQMRSPEGNLNDGNHGVGLKTDLQTDKTRVDLRKAEKSEPSKINMLKGQRKLRKVVERASGNVHKKAGEKDNLASEKGVEHVAEAPLARKGKTQRKIFNEPVKEKAVTLENEKHLNQESSASSIRGEAGFQIRKQFLNQKFGLGVNGVEEIENEIVGKAHRVVSRKKLKGVIEIKSDHSYRKLRPRTKFVKENQFKHVDQDGLVTNDAVNSGMKLNGMVKIENYHLHQKPSPKSKSVEEAHFDYVDEDRLVKKHGVNGLVKLRKIVKEEKISNGKNVVYAQKTALRTGACSKAMAQNIGACSKAMAQNIGACSKSTAQIEYGHVHLISDQSGSHNRTQGAEKLQKVAKRMTVDKSDHEAKRKTGQKNFFLSGNTVKYENEIPAEKEKIRRKNLTKKTKGKNVVNQDHEVNRKEMTLENETHLSLMSSACNIVKGVSKKNVAGANSKVVVQIGKQLFYRKPGFGNNSKDTARADNQQAQDHGKKLKGIEKRVNVISGADKNSSIPIEQDRAVKKTVKNRGDLKKLVKEEKMVKENNDISAQKNALRKRGRPKKQIDNNVQVRSGRQSNNGKFLHNNHDKNNQENEVDDGVSSDVEILENAEEVITDLFREEDLERILRVDMDTEYAKNLMSVLKKPFDNREYKRLSDCVQVYYKAHPSLKRKIIKYRYKTAKRLNILRGFFYWLQHCIAEGAFKPWEEKKCLAMEPESN